MKCERAEELYLDYVYGEANPDEVRDIEAHLADCPDCADKLASLGRIRSMAADLPDPEPSRVLTGRIIAQAREEAESRRSMWGFGWAKIAGLLCVMIAAVMLALPQFESYRRAPEPPAPVTPSSDEPAEGVVRMRGGSDEGTTVTARSEKPALPEPAPAPPPEPAAVDIKVRDVSTDSPVTTTVKKETLEPSPAGSGLGDSEIVARKPSKPAAIPEEEPAAEIPAKVMGQDQLAKLDEALRKNGRSIEVIEKGKELPAPVVAQAPAKKPAPKPKRKTREADVPSATPPPLNEKLHEKPKAGLNHVKDPSSTARVKPKPAVAPGLQNGDAAGGPVETASLQRKSRSLGMAKAPTTETKTGSTKDDLKAAEKALAAGQYKVAVEKFQSIISQLPAGHPDRSKACLGLAQAWEGLGNVSKAIVAYQTLAQESPAHKDMAQRRIKELTGQ